MKAIHIAIFFFALELCTVLSNPNTGYQSNWRWYPSSRNLGSPPNGSQTSDEGNARVRRNPNIAYQPNWRWIAYPRNLDSPTNDTEPSDEGNTRVRRNPNIAYQPNWRWIAYPRNLDSPPNGSQTSDEGNARVRRNPNIAYQPNWRWIAYPRNLDSPPNSSQTSDEGNARVRRNLNTTIGTGEAHENHKHSRPKPYEINQKNNDSSFDRSLYEGWYQTPASLAANKTLLFSGTWGNLHEMSQSDIVDTCDITNISICDDSNNIPGELRQCFLKPEDITSYAANLYNVTADKIQILKEDPNVQKLPFPDAFNVTISEVNQINGCDGNPTVCHTMMTNSSDCDTVYLCHSVKGTTVKQVIIDYNEEIKDVQMYAMCHMNTHNFGEEHVAFRMLHKHPGDGVCHFISPNSFLVCKD
ncbi:unnamed protein product [Adineta steineri]|uniref:BURP domain-containing protein n=3 Tax=Adineta steineri TaxID=433720 RepID=A0A813Z677_9BILA|nr:unnamed protein product [Adineta steineri]